MNMLAHLALAPDDPPAMIGNLLADYVKGSRAFAAMPPGVRVGILQHRRVDAFTDSHPQVLRAITILRPRWSIIAGVLVDIYFDHILSRTWSCYFAQPVNDFISQRFRQMQGPAREVPLELRALLWRLMLTRRLESYQSPRGVKAALVRVGGRLKRMRPELDLASAMDDLAEHDAVLAECFAEFFPELRAAAAEGWGITSEGM